MLHGTIGASREGLLGVIGGLCAGVRPAGSALLHTAGRRALGDVYMRLGGIHHITAITADEPLERLGELLSLPVNSAPAKAGAAAGLAATIADA